MNNRSSGLRRAGFYGVLVFFALLYLGPFAIQVATSFKTDADAVANPLSLVPDPGVLDAYRRMFGLTEDSSVPFLRWFGNSTLVAVTVTIGRVFFCSLAGYALSRLQFTGRRMLFVSVLAVMSVPGVVLLIPKFLVLNYLSIYDTYPAMILPLLVDAAGVFIMKQFFDSISISIEEAARIDGASIFQTFWFVVLPMARPALITLTILSFQGSWNEFTHMLVATERGDRDVLTTGMATLFSGGLGGGEQFPLKLAVALIATLPVAFVFFTFQRYFTAGANEGAEKG
ncbi:MAG: carbohydrate ABC transporter permease [Actinomycetota bacterium]|nr:carbohydrate ABC transporter permease [Actinomycetota bacterium]